MIHDSHLILRGLFVQMIGNRYSIRFFLPVSALLAAAVAPAGELVDVRPHIVEVFTTTESPVTGKSTFNRKLDSTGMEFHIYELDGIQRIETKLSDGLTADPEQSKQVVLQRFQQLHEEDRARMQRAAMGLAKAVPATAPKTAPTTATTRTWSSVRRMPSGIRSVRCRASSLVSVCFARRKQPLSFRISNPGSMRCHGARKCGQWFLFDIDWISYPP